jgi:hypothetical protein
MKPPSVRPAEAPCALLRGGQLLVAGDTKQLPPASFFDTLNDTVEDEENVTPDLQRILGMPFKNIIDGKPFTCLPSLILIDINMPLLNGRVADQVAQLLAIKRLYYGIVFYLPASCRQPVC